MITARTGGFGVESRFLGGPLPSVASGEFLFCESVCTLLLFGSILLYFLLFLLYFLARLSSGRPNK